MTGGEQGEQSRRGPGLSPLPLLPEKDHQTEGFRRYLSSGVPRLPAAASPSPGKLLELFDLEDPLMSPQGSQISFVIVRGTSGFLVHPCMDE